MRFATENVDLVEGGRYCRLLAAGRQIALATVTNEGAVTRPRLAVTLHSPSRAPLRVADFEAQLRHILCTDLDLGPFYRLARKDGMLTPLVSRFRGLRITSSPTLFEALVTAVLSQQVNLSFGSSRGRTRSNTRWSIASAASGVTRAGPISRFRSRGGSPRKPWRPCVGSG